MPGQQARQTTAQPGLCKKTIRRTIRCYFVTGSCRYKGKLYQDEPTLAAVFGAELVANVRAQVKPRYDWWNSLDPALLLRDSAGSLKLVKQQPPSRPIVPSKREVLTFLTYNVLTLADTSRLMEIAEDCYQKEVDVVGLQSTCWRLNADIRSEWTVTDRFGRKLYHFVHWNREQRDRSGGVGLLLRVDTFPACGIAERFDHLPGRIGALRWRTKNRMHDYCFVVGYAPTAAAAVADRESFFGQLQALLRSFPLRCATWLLLDANATVGEEVFGNAVGQKKPATTNDNGFMLAQTCYQADLALYNTFVGDGSSTWYQPGNNTGNGQRIDYIAGPCAKLSSVMSCVADKYLAQRWRHCANIDHVPVIVRQRMGGYQLRVSAPPPLARWNKTALRLGVQDPQTVSLYFDEVKDRLLPWLHGLEGEFANGPSSVWNGLNELLLE
eukprot:2009968-Amphidinium_carterae.2